MNDMSPTTSSPAFMTTPAAYTDALERALGRIVADMLRDAEVQAAKGDAVIAALQARNAEIEMKHAALEAMVRGMVEARLAEVRDGVDGVPGEIGPEGPAGAVGPVGERGTDGIDGIHGEPGSAGERGFDGAPGEVGPTGPMGETGPQGEKGDAGDAGPQGERGFDGAPGEVGPIGDPGLPGEKGEPGESIVGPQGERGADGVPGESIVGPIGDRGEKGDPGESIVGPQGERGIDGAPGESVVGPIGERGEKGDLGDIGPQGERGIEGPPGKLRICKAWTDAVHYEGETVTRNGGTYQALRDTGREPSHEDWICVAARGADGLGITPCGTFDAEKGYFKNDVVMTNGSSFVALRDSPGACPGDGWQLWASRGSRGDKGETVRGQKGDKGDAGVTPVALGVDTNGLFIMTMSDGATLTADFYPILERIMR